VLWFVPITIAGPQISAFPRAIPTRKVMRLPSGKKRRRPKSSRDESNDLHRERADGLFPIRSGHPPEVRIDAAISSKAQPDLTFAANAPGEASRAFHPTPFTGSRRAPLKREMRHSLSRPAHDLRRKTISFPSGVQARPLRNRPVRSQAMRLATAHWRERECHRLEKPAPST